MLGYNCLISAMCKDQKIEEVMEIVEKMKRDGCKPDTFNFNSLIYVLCKAGKMDEAFQLYENFLLEGVTANSVTYNTLFMEFYRRENGKNL